MAIAVDAAAMERYRRDRIREERRRFAFQLRMRCWESDFGVFVVGGFYVAKSLGHNELEVQDMNNNWHTMEMHPDGQSVVYVPDHDRWKFGFRHDVVARFELELDLHPLASTAIIEEEDEERVFPRLRFEYERYLPFEI